MPCNSNYKNYTFKELKAFCEKFELQSSGNKEQLFKRLTKFHSRINNISKQLKYISPKSRPKSSKKAKSPKSPKSPKSSKKAKSPRRKCPTKKTKSPRRKCPTKKAKSPKSSKKTKSASFFTKSELEKVAVTYGLKLISGETKAELLKRLNHHMKSTFDSYFSDSESDFKSDSESDFNSDSESDSENNVNSKQLLLEWKP